MSAAQSLPFDKPVRGRRYSEAEYLAFDEKAEGRWEYFDGYILPVGRPDLANKLDPTFRAGASPAHYTLASTLLRSLFARLRKGCRPFSSDARVHIPITGGYAYPDVVIVCGRLEFFDPDKALPSLTNPVVIIEILSESTAEHDRIGKFMRYRSIPSLQQYLLVDSRKKQTELFTRREDATWNYSPAAQDADQIDLTSVGCALTLAEVYEGLDLPSTDDLLLAGLE